MTSKLLIVDDNNANLQVAVKTLISEKIEVFTAKSGLEALKALESNPVDLILLDINMPGLDGFETFEEIKKMGETADVPVIFLTSYNDKEILQKCFRCGAVDFVSKPFCPEELQSRIQTHLTLSSHKRGLQQAVDKKTEELQKTIRKLRASEKVKENFLAMMSHELRTPLNGILGTSQILRITDMSEDNTGLLDDLDESTLRLNRLLSDILNFVNLNSSVNQPYSSNIIMDNYKEQLEVLAHQCNSGEAPFSLSVLENIPNKLRFDYNSSLQIVECLLSNAFKFSDEQEVLLRVGYQTLDEAHGELIIEVIDQGIGIPEEYQEKVFEKFYQIDSGVSRSYEGSGIGLALVKQLTNLMEGKIEIISEVNKGCTVKATLPVVVAEPEVERKPKNVVDARILIVEDVKTNQAYLKRILNLKNTYVLTADCADECMEILNETEVDLIFMDFVLPGKNGAEISYEIRNDDRFRQLPIVGVTAKADNDCRYECLNAGMNEFIAKPYSKDEVFNCLSHYFILDEEL